MKVCHNFTEAIDYMTSAYRDTPYDRQLKSRKEVNTKDHHNPLFHPAEAESTLAPAGNVPSNLTSPALALLPIQHTSPLDHAPSNAKIVPFSFDWPSDSPYDVEKLVYAKLTKSKEFEKPAYLTDSAKGRRQA